MANFKSLKDYRRSMGARIVALRRAGVRSSREVAEHVKMRAKQLAPRQSGTLRNNIRVRKRAKGHVVESWVPGSFKYNKWVNQEEGYKTLGPYKKAHPDLGIKKGAILEYRKSPTHFKWTGTAGYFDIALSEGRKRFRKIIQKHVGAAIQGKVL